jgi:enoyl-CoA hydratase/carnithine racemase
MSAPALLVDRESSGVLVVRLNRPARRNALDRSLVEALDATFTAVTERAVVLGSTDPACFSAGIDISMSDDERAEVSDQLYVLYERMIDLPVPIVAAVGGHAVGGGAQLAVAADLRVGNPATVIRFVGAGHGLAVGGWALPTLIGRGRAIELCTSMRPVGADEALATGLIGRVGEDALSGALAVARELTRLDTGAVGRLKAAIRDEAGLRQALHRERQENRAAWTGHIRPRGNRELHSRADGEI